MGSNDNARGAFFALRASDGSLVWTFYGAYPHGTSFTDVNGVTFDAGDTWTTKVTPNDTPNNCYLTGGAAPWQQGAIDNDLGMIYVPFGNVRSCTGSQNGEGRPGDNLFGSSVVAIDYKTGAYKWHFQAVKHDIWDMDNALTPVLADIVVGGADEEGPVLRQQVGVPVHAGSRHRQAGAADRIPRRPRRHAQRPGADAADPAAEPLQQAEPHQRGHAVHGAREPGLQRIRSTTA